MCESIVNNSMHQFRQCNCNYKLLEINLLIFSLDGFKTCNAQFEIDGAGLVSDLSVLQDSTHSL